MWRNGDRRPRAVEDDELRPKEDVAVDGEGEAIVGLETTKADCEETIQSAKTLRPLEGYYVFGMRGLGEKLTIFTSLRVCTNVGEIHVIATYGGEIAIPNCDLQIWQRGVAGKNDSPGLLVQLRTLNSVPVRNEHVIRDEHERSASVDDGLAVGDVDSLALNLSGRGVDFPESAAGVYRRSSQGARECSGVDVAELVGAD